MIIDFEHHYKPYTLWKKRGGKPGEVVRIFDEEGRQIRYEFDNTAAAPKIQRAICNVDPANSHM